MLCYIHNYSRPSDGPVVARRAGPPGQLPTGCGLRGGERLRGGGLFIVDAAHVHAPEARADQVREPRTVPAVLVDVVEPVPLRVGPRLEVLGTSRLVLHGRDEVTEEDLSRRRFDAVEALVHVLERFWK